MAFIIKRDDTLPPLEAELKDADNDPIDLTGVEAVYFYAKSDSKFIQKIVSVVDPDDGKVEVTWAAEDTDTAGTFDCEFELQWGLGAIQTVPNDGYFQIVIVPDLDQL